MWSEISSSIVLKQSSSKAHAVEVGVYYSRRLQSGLWKKGRICSSPIVAKLPHMADVFGMPQHPVAPSWRAQFFVGSFLIQAGLRLVLVRGFKGWHSIPEAFVKVLEHVTATSFHVQLSPCAISICFCVLVLGKTNRISVAQ